MIRRVHRTSEPVLIGALVRGATRYRWHGFFACAVVLTGLSMTFPTLWERERASLLTVATPVIETLNAPFKALSVTVSEISGLATLRAENERITAENERLMQWYSRALSLQAENVSLRELLKMPVASDLTHMSAPVIGDGNSAFARAIIVGAGARDNLERGQPVVTSEGVIGRIHDIGEKSSRVMLISDLSSRIPVIVEGSAQRAVAAGQNGTDLILDHLPPDHDVRVGDRIITSGEGGVFPAGLPMGVVSHVTADEVRMTPFASSEKVRYVRIVDRVEEGGIRTRLVP